MRGIMRQSVWWIALVLLLVGCSGDSAEPTPAPTASPEVTSEPSASPIPPPTISPPPTVNLPSQTVDLPDTLAVRIVHAVPDLGTVNVEIGGLLYATNLRYERFTAATEIDAGSYTLRVLLDDAAIDTAPLLEETLVLQPRQTVILTLAGTAEAPELLQHLEDDAPLNTGEARVRVIHTVPDSPDLIVMAEDRVIAGPVAYQAMSGAAVLLAGEVVLDFIQGEDSVFTFARTFTERRSYTLVVTREGADAWQIVVLDTRVPGIAGARVIQAAPDAGVIDAYLDDRLLAGGLDSYAVQARQPVAARPQVLTIYPAGADRSEAEPLLATQVNFTADEALTLVIAGSLSQLRVFDLEDNVAPLADGMSRFRVLHVHEPQPLITFSVSRVEQSFEPLRFGEAGPTLDVTADAYDIFIDRVDPDATETLTLETAEALLLDAGFSYLYLVTGRDEGTPPVVYREEVGFTTTSPDIIGADRVNPDDADTLATAQVRLVHAIEDLGAVDFLIDETLVAEGVAYGEAAPFVTVTQGDHVIVARENRTGEEHVVRTLEFGPNRVYSVYVHGFAEQNLYDVTQIEDVGLMGGGRNATVRLVNLSLDQTTQFGLGFLPTTGGPAPQPSVRDNGSVVRPSLFAEVVQLVPATDGQSTGLTAAIPAVRVDFLVIDPFDDTLALGLGDYTLEPDAIYEVVAYQLLDSRLLNGFVLRYEPPS